MITESGVRVAHLTNGTELVLCLHQLRGNRSYADIERCTGIRADEIAKIESGKTTAVAWTTLIRLLGGLDVTPNELLKVREPLSTDSITASMLAALESGQVSEHVTDVWVRGNNRQYEIEEPNSWQGTEYDETVVLTYRRDNSEI